MAKAELLSRIAQGTGKTEKEAREVWKVVQQAILAELQHNREVPIDGVGKLKPAVRAARKGRNPQTGEEMEIPEKQTVKLAVSKVFSR